MFTFSLHITFFLFFFIFSYRLSLSCFCAFRPVMLLLFLCLCCPLFIMFQQSQCVSQFYFCGYSSSSSKKCSTNDESVSMILPYFYFMLIILISECRILSQIYNIILPHHFASTAENTLTHTSIFCAPFTFHKF